MAWVLETAGPVMSSITGQLVQFSEAISHTGSLHWSPILVEALGTSILLQKNKELSH